MRLFATVLSLCCSLGLGAQDYFQQRVDYMIHVRLDDETNMLHADEEVIYHNQSPDTLTFLYFHLWPNAYKNRSTALAKQLRNLGMTSMMFASEDELGYIDSLAFTLDGKPCVWEYDPEHIDICKIYLEKPLEPGATVTVATPFRVKLPSGTISRLGHIGQSYQVTQWYPKPAVYDKNGWHPMPYLTQGEFYSEFGSYDVFLELPDNYVVGATGDLQTASEVEWMDKMAKEGRAWVKARKEQLDWETRAAEMDFPKSAPINKTLHFHQDRVHDFAWFADKRYHVLKGEVTLPGNSDTVTLWSLFTNKQAEMWQYSTDYSHDAVHYYSLWNGDYPYKQVTVVDGTISAGGGMEYPNVTVIGEAQTELLLETVIMHEVGHNWFYGILGSNERDHPWLDEGINSYNEQRYLSTKYPEGWLFGKDKTHPIAGFTGLDAYGLKDQHYLSYLLQARTGRDQSLNNPSQEFSQLNYGFVVYSKSAVFFNYLRHSLGDSLMDACMHRYFEDYKFRHPDPEALQAVFEEVSKQDLDWFFNDILRSSYKLDYRLCKVTSDDSSTYATVRSNTPLRGPVHVALMKDGEVVESQWVQTMQRDTTVRFSGTGDRVEIDPFTYMPEVRRDNNYVRTRGLFRHIEPLRLKSLGRVEDPRFNDMYYLFTIGANVPNGWMPGVLLYNHLIPLKRFSYFLMPMFALKGGQLVGMGSVAYTLTPAESAFESIELGLAGKRFIYDRNNGVELAYIRLNPSVTFYLKPLKYSGMFEHNVRLGTVTVLEQTAFLSKKKVNTNFYNRGEYRFVFKHPVMATWGTVRAEQHTDFFRVSAEVMEHVNLNKKLHANFRLFAGHFLVNNALNPRYNWRLDGQNYATDYAYDSDFLDRSGIDGVLVQQYSATHGGMKIPTAFGQSTSWMAAINAKVRPGKLPVGIFADFGMFPGSVATTNPFLFDAGVYVPIVPDVVEVYFPLLYSADLDREIAANGTTYAQLIRFQFDVSQMRLLERLRRLDIP